MTTPLCPAPFASLPRPAAPRPPPEASEVPAAVASMLERQGFRRLGPAALQPGELEALGFLAASEAAARTGAWLVPVLWHTGERVALRSHRLLLDEGAPDEPRRGPRRPVLAALGALRTDPVRWGSAARRVLLVEGDLLAVALAAALPDEAVVGCPMPSRLAEEGLGRARVDLRRLFLRDRLVVVIPAREGPRSPLLTTLLDELAARGARVHLTRPAPPGLPGPPDDAASGPALEDWLTPPPCAAASAGPGPRLRDCLPPSLFTGPDHLVLPEPFVLLEGPGAPLGMQRPKRQEPLSLSSSAFWPLAAIDDAQGQQLLMAMVVHPRGGGWALKKALMPRAIVHDRRALCGFFAAHGLNLHAHAEGHVTAYLTTFLDRNEVPTLTAQTSSGWDEARQGFQYGHEPLGQVLLGSIEGDPTTLRLFRALSLAGDPAVWKQTAEAMVALSPAAALVLAAAIASPMLRLFGWPTIGVLFGALGGAGKSTMLRLGASVFGASGDGGQNQPSDLVLPGTGTVKGLLLQFGRLADLPHLVDELRPSPADARHREDIADVLHQIFEGQEYTRAARTSNGTRTGSPFPGCTVVAGEVAPSDFLRKGGVIRRYLTPPAPYAPEGQHLGQFRLALARNHGHLGRQLVEALVETSADQRQDMARRHALYLQPLGITPEHPEHLRSWSEQIATALAAVDVCAQLCPDLCPQPTPWKAALHAVWAELQGAAEEKTVDVIAQVEDKIRSFIARNRYHLHPSPAYRARLRLRGARDDHERLLLVPREPALGQIAEAEHEGEEDELLLKVDVHQSSLTKFLLEEGYSEGTFTGALARRGLIETTESQTRLGNVARSVRLNGTVTRVYRLVLARPEAVAAIASPSLADRPSRVLS